MSQSDQAVIDTAKAHQECAEDEVYTLSTGVRVRFRPVSPSLLAEVTSRIHDPEPPTFFNEEKGREEPNEGHPAYIAAMLAADNARGIAALDAMAMFGVELVDPIPDDGWDRKLQLLGVKFDTEDKVVREFYYIKHIAMSMDDYGLLKGISGVTEEGVNRARSSFRRNTKRNANR